MAFPYGVASCGKRLDNSSMRIDILTLFPKMFESYFQASILERAQQAQLLLLRLHQLRDYATDKHRVTDEPPYGGGGGMILKPEPVFRAVEAILADYVMGAGSESSPEGMPPVILLTPQGRTFTQTVAQELAKQQREVPSVGGHA